MLVNNIAEIFSRKILCSSCKKVEDIIKDDGPLVSVCTKCGKIINKAGKRICGKCSRHYGLCQRCGMKL